MLKGQVYVSIAIAELFLNHSNSSAHLCPPSNFLCAASNHAAPAAGPAHPYHAPSFMPHLGSAAHANGAIEPTHVAPWAFEEQFHTYNSFGYAVGTSGEVVGDARKFNTSGGDTVNSALPSKRPRSPLGGVTATAATTTMAADSQAGDGSSSSSSNSTVVTTVEAAVAAPAAGAGAGAGGGGGGGGKKKKNSEGASLRAARLEAARAFELGGDPDQELGPWSEYKSEEDQLLATIEVRLVCVWFLAGIYFFGVSLGIGMMQFLPPQEEACEALAASTSYLVCAFCLSRTSILLLFSPFGTFLRPAYYPSI